MQTFLLNSPAARHLRLLAVIPIVLSLCGCSRQTRHQVLTFFFTGVPALEEKRADPAAVIDPSRNSEKQGEKAPPKNRKAALPGEKEPLPALPEAPRLHSHPLWAGGNCSICHEGAITFGFQPIGQAKKKAADKVFYSGGGMPGTLRHPKEKICAMCHTDKTGLRAIKDNLWLHNPTARGECLACHDAHQSKHRGTLRKAPEQLCQECHPAEDLAKLPMHNDAKEPCLSCHNPHMGKDRRLLTQEYQEVKQDAKREL
ncbi:MAG: cytochrome c3 family protein [Desulfuromonadaceae bacterium]|nr:cytochrome c3 family protein [Desulfuromonadaceae bacterium]